MSSVLEVKAIQSTEVYRMYARSAFVFSITRAAFLGYLYRDASLALRDGVALGGSWLCWSVLFGALLLFLSFMPKPRWGYYLNPITLTFLVWLFYYLGMNFSQTTQANIKDMVTFSITHFGGPIWILVMTWIWHFVVCLRIFGEEVETA